MKWYQERYKEMETLDDLVQIYQEEELMNSMIRLGLVRKGSKDVGNEKSGHQSGNESISVEH